MYDSTMTERFDLKKSYCWFFGLEIVFFLALFSFSFKVILLSILLTLVLFLSIGNLPRSLFVFIAGSTFVRFGAGHTTQDTLVLILVFIVFITNLLLKNQKILLLKRTVLNLPLFLFLFFCLEATLAGFFNGGSVRELAIELFPYLCFGLFFVVVNTLNSKKDIYYIFKLLVYVAWINSLIGIYTYISGGFVRVGAYLFSVFPSMVAAVLICRSFYESNKRIKLRYWFMSLPMLIHLALSFTRGYWIAFLVAIFLGFILFNLLERRKVLLYSGKFILVSLLLMLMILAVGKNLRISKSGETLAESLVKRTQSIFSVGLRRGGELDVSGISNLYRLMEWKESLKRIKEKPILGYGFGYRLSFFDIFSKRKVSTWFVHQNYLLMALKIGLLGLISFIWLSLAFLKRGTYALRNIKDPYDKGMILGFITNYLQLMIVALTNYVYANINHVPYIAFTMGAVMFLSYSPNSNLKGELVGD